MKNIIIKPLSSELTADYLDDFDYQGPYHLYQKAGFVEAAKENGQVVMRKILSCV